MTEALTRLVEGAAELPEEAVRLLVPSPLGGLGIELRGTTVTRLVIVPKGRDRALYAPFSKVKRSDALDEVLGRLSEHLAGARRDPAIAFDLGPSGVRGLARRVLRETAKIPYGQTRTYQEIAAATGLPDGYRLVLSTLLSNPIPILIPCHRVVTAKSGIGSYIAGTRKKAWLLKLETQVEAAAGADAGTG